VPPPRSEGKRLECILRSMALQTSSADLNVRVRAEFAGASLSGSKAVGPAAEWLPAAGSVI
jgi:hypothetical protein